MTKPSQQHPIEPREPKAYPSYPKRPEGARRPVYQPVPDEVELLADSPQA